MTRTSRGLLALPKSGLPWYDSRFPAVRVIANTLLLLAVFLVTLLPASRAVAPYYRKLRGIEATRKSRTGNLRLALAFLLPMLLWVLLFNLPPATGLSPRSAWRSRCLDGSPSSPPRRCLPSG